MNLPEKLQTQLKGVKNLPSPSRVAMSIIELARDPDLNLAAVAGLINKDPALTAKILRTANSALFAQRRRSDNLRKALIVMGLDATLTLALSFSLVSGFRKQDVAGINLPFYWRHCLLSATAARVAGEVLGRTDTEDLFLAGLLQDIGVLAIDKCEPGFYGDAAPDTFEHDVLCNHEIEKLGADHADVGAWLMTNWNMPEKLRNAVANSHQYSGTDQFELCVAMSGPIASFCVADSDTNDIEKLAEQFSAATGAPEEALGELLGQLSSQIPDVEALYESNLVEGGQVEDILNQARETLMVRNLEALQSAAVHARKLEEENRRDALTGVFNRAHMIKVLQQEFVAARENRWPLTVAFIDMDSFKQINDTKGHLAGDALLKGMANALADNLRDSDIVTRYGGDEFVIIMPGTDKEMASAAGRRISGLIAKIKHDLGDGQELAVTISMGLASLDLDCPFETVEEMLEAADNAVYAVKAAGRNGFASWNQMQSDGNIVTAPKRDYRAPETMDA